MGALAAGERRTAVMNWRDAKTQAWIHLM